MELTDSETLLKALRTTNTRRQSGVRPAAAGKAADFASSYVAAASKSRRPCRCGLCYKCRDNARWERIFKEKFADPEYYNRPLRRDSSLREL